MALGLLRALHEQGRAVPRDVSVVGFDDLPQAAFCWPPLTTVRQDFEGLGTRAFELALRAIAGESSPAIDLVAAVVIDRSTTALPCPIEPKDLWAGAEV